MLSRISTFLSIITALIAVGAYVVPATFSDTHLKYAAFLAHALSFEILAVAALFLLIGGRQFVIRFWMYSLNCLRKLLPDALPTKRIRVEAAAIIIFGIIIEAFHFGRPILRFGYHAINYRREYYEALNDHFRREIEAEMMADEQNLDFSDAAKIARLILDQYGDEPGSSFVSRKLTDYLSYQSYAEYTENEARSIEQRQGLTRESLGLYVEALRIISRNDELRQKILLDLQKVRSESARAYSQISRRHRWTPEL